MAADRYIVLYGGLFQGENTMAVKFIAIKCPECGADLSYEEGRKVLFCQYCGAKILVDNENEHVYRYVDDADVKRAETEQMVQLKKMELAEKHRAEAEARRKHKVRVTIVLAAIAVILMLIMHFAEGSFYIGYFIIMGIVFALLYIWNNNNDPDSTDVDKAVVPSSVNGYESMHYAEVAPIFRNAGFTDVECIGLGDLKTGWLKEPGTVSYITINERKVSPGGKSFPLNARVIIYFHSFQ